MRLAVFGGTGSVGHLVVEQALSAGHQVNAFVRDRSRLSIEHPDLSVFEGRLEDGETVPAALQGAEAVISALSAGHDVLRHFGEAALPVMRAHGPRRLVALVGASLRRPGDPKTFGLGLMSIAMRLIPGRMLADAESFAALLDASGLDWTLARSANFSSAPGTGRVQSAVSYAMSPGSSIPRADVAAFLLAETIERRFIRQAPMIEAG